MAEVQESNSPSGIKLFGATISLDHPTALPNLVVDDDDQENLKKSDHQLMMEKRPDKIIPCPRCKSMETKFCYFNNYNVNQPRHFCKGCQRYWTAGGALRNVPIGAGRRKAKPPGREGCLFDASSGAMQQLDFEEWRVEDHGGFRRLFPGKRRRFAPDSQTC